MCEYIIFFTMTPFIEWSIHKLLHQYDNTNHMNHHIDVYSGKFHNFKTLNKVEYLPPIVIVIAYYFQYWYILIFLSRYWIIHTMIHYVDSDIIYLQQLKNHHMVHHKFKKYNFAVSGIYPDILFGTYWGHHKLGDTPNPEF
jgi:hypothetical protein